MCIKRFAVQPSLEAGDARVGDAHTPRQFTKTPSSNHVHTQQAACFGTASWLAIEWRRARGRGHAVMAKTDFKSVDEYLAKQPDDVRATLQQVRSILRKAVPDADEVISYQIPAYKWRGVPVIYFAGWKQHYSLYPATAPVLAALKSDLADYTVTKGTIRFPLSEPVPVRLIERIAKLRAKEAAARLSANLGWGKDGITRQRAQRRSSVRT
jgi:uncharacterized protein YdhG (YjbR/CyaY superfamily)